jgi:hypothetical protein
MRFGADDEEAFYSARDELLSRFGDTLGEGSARVYDAQLALDWKWWYADGDLASWQLEDLEEFLLEWCPRKVTMPPDEAASIPVSLSAFLSFLHDGGLLSAASAPLHRLQVYLAGVGGQVVDAMGDRSRFGMSKSLLTGMAELGPLPDLSDPEALQEVMDRFNGLPYDVRGEILGLDDSVEGPWDGVADGVELAPAPPIAVVELSSLAAAAPILEQVQTVREFVGAGRKLTAKGNLTVADAKSLAAALGDPALEMRAEHGFTIRTADNLPQTQFALRWARAAGAVRVANGRISATASWAKLDPVSALRRALRPVFDKGPLALWNAGFRWGPHFLIDVLDEGVPHLLAVLWANPDGVDFEELLAAIDEVCDHLFDLGPRPSPGSPHFDVRIHIDRLFDVLAMTGVVSRTGAESVTTRYGSERRSGGTLSLTALGRGVLAPFLSEYGYEVPAVGELGERALSELFERIGSWGDDRIRAEFDSWVEHHGAAEAADQMAAVLLSYGDPRWPVTAVALAGRLPAPDDENAIRRFLDTPARGYAINWLEARGAAKVPDDFDAVMRAGMEMMAVQAAGGTDVAFLDTISGIDDIDAFIEDAWHVPVPQAVVVLEAIGRVHPDKAVAKAARKAVFKHRSLMANIAHPTP